MPPSAITTTRSGLSYGRRVIWCKVSRNFPRGLETPRLVRQDQSGSNVGGSQRVAFGSSFPRFEKTRRERGSANRAQSFGSAFGVSGDDRCKRRTGRVYLLVASVATGIAEGLDRGEEVDSMPTRPHVDLLTSQRSLSERTARGALWV